MLAPWLVHWQRCAASSLHLAALRDIRVEGVEQPAGRRYTLYFSVCGANVAHKPTTTDDLGRRLSGPSSAVAASCLALLNAGDTTGSVHSNVPSGMEGAANHDVFRLCDHQTTDGSGWMLTHEYAHTGGENEALVKGIVLTDPSGEWTAMPSPN